MFDKIPELYSKYAIYTIIILIISNLIALDDPQIFTQFFNTIIKFLPSSVVNYFHERNINTLDALCIFTIISSISGVGFIWNLLFHKWYLKYTSEKYETLDENFKYPRFHMDSIYTFMSELTILFFLTFLLFSQIGFTSTETIINFIRNNVGFTLVLSGIGTMYAFFVCVLLIMSGLGSIKEKN